MSMFVCMCRSWKYHQMALEMLKLLTRHDVMMPASGVKLFVDNMVHDTLLIRKVRHRFQ